MLDADTKRAIPCPFAASKLILEVVNSEPWSLAFSALVAGLCVQELSLKDLPVFNG